MASINGIERWFSEELPDSPQAATMQVLAALSIEKVSPDELPSADQTATLLSQVEELCSGRRGTNFNGIFVRQLPHTEARTTRRPLQLTWNVAGTLGGFGISATWDGALASIENIPTRTTQGKTRRALWMRPESTESLYIPHSSGNEAPIPIIRKTLWHPSAPVYTDRQARGSEVQTVSAMLHDFVVCESLEDSSELSTKRPTYLEIGFGIDPAVFRGNRRYRTKTYLGVDPGVGDYENPLGEYSEAVRTSADIFANEAENNRPDEHIYFVIGDAQNTDLPSKSVREVFMSNVVNAPLDASVRSNILQESNRIIEHNGTLVLRVNWHQDVWPSAATVKLLRDHGFTVVRSVSHDEPQYTQLEAQYGTPSQVPAPEGYYIIAIAS